MRGSAWCQEDFTGRVAALLHGIVWGGCPGETDGRRHPAPVSPPCDLVGACWQCPSWPLPRLPSRPTLWDHTVPYMDPHWVPVWTRTHSSSPAGRGRSVFCMSLCSMQAFDFLQLIISTNNHCNPFGKRNRCKRSEVER